MKQRIWLWLCILWMLLIWVLSSIPSQQLPSYNVIGLDKIAHFGVYFVWGILANLWFYYRQFSGKKVWAIGLIMLALAAADESHQYFIPGRDLSIYDFFANALGLISAFVAFKYLGKRFFK
ncbi:MAG: VanZ family protein [Candidatus Cloacimonadaceae bacterium]